MDLLLPVAFLFIRSFECCSLFSSTGEKVIITSLDLVRYYYSCVCVCISYEQVGEIRAVAYATSSDVLLMFCTTF